MLVLVQVKIFLVSHPNIKKEEAPTDTLAHTKPTYHPSISFLLASPLTFALDTIMKVGTPIKITLKDDMLITSIAARDVNVSLDELHKNDYFLLKKNLITTEQREMVENIRRTNHQKRNGNKFIIRYIY